MAKTAVGLFENQTQADAIVRDLEANGIPRNEVRILGEPLGMAVGGATSTPHTDFEVALRAEFQKIGAPEPEAYIQGVQRQGVLVFVTGSDEKVSSAAEIMNHRGAIDAEKLSGGELHLPSAMGDIAAPMRDHSVQAGRSQAPERGARVFAW